MSFACGRWGSAAVAGPSKLACRSTGRQAVLPIRKTLEREDYTRSFTPSGMRSLSPAIILFRQSSTYSRVSRIPQNLRSPHPPWHRPFSTSIPRFTPPSTTATLPKKDHDPKTSTTNTSIDVSAPSASISEKSQAKTDWSIILKLAGNIWPKDSPKTKIRVVGALGLLVAAKVLNVQVPFFFKQIVDSLNVEITADTTVWILAGTAIAGCAFFRNT